MKIAFFLTPKAEVAWVKSKSTARQALERMEHYRYTAVPVLSPEGHYESTITEGDFLWYLKQNPEVSFEDLERVPLSELPRRLRVSAVSIDAEIERLFELALDQNFVPVIDDREIFIGIVRRRSVLAFFQERMLAAVRSATPG